MKEIIDNVLDRAIPALRKEAESTEIEGYAEAIEEIINKLNEFRPKIVDAVKR